MLSFVYISPSGYFSLNWASATYLYPPCLTFLPLSLFALSLFHLFTSLFSSLHVNSPLHHSLFLSLSVSPRAYLSVVWRMGLQHRGQGTWCSSCHRHGNLHHDAGSGATHPAEVELPRDTWQKELQHWPLQGNPEVSHCGGGGAWSGHKRKYG